MNMNTADADVGRIPKPSSDLGPGLRLAFAGVTNLKRSAEKLG